VTRQRRRPKPRIASTRRESRREAPPAGSPREWTMQDAIDVFVGFLVCAVVVARPLFPGVAGVGLADDFWQRTFFIVAAMLGLVLVGLRRAYEREFVLVRSGLDVPLAAWFFAMCAATALALHRRPGVEFLVEFLSLALVMVLIYSHPQRRPLARTVLRCLVATVVVTCVYGFYDYAYGWNERARYVESMSRGDLGRAFAGATGAMVSSDDAMLDNFLTRARGRDVFSTFLLANTFAGFLVLVVPVLLAIALSGLNSVHARLRAPPTGSDSAGDSSGGTSPTGVWARHVWPAAGLVFALAGVGALLLTRSKGGIVAGIFALATLAVLAATLGRPKRYRIVLWVSAGMVAAAAVFVPIVAGSVSTDGGPLDSLAVRAGFWQGASRVWRGAPILGRGLGSFKDYYYEVKAPWAHEVVMPHSIFFKMLAEGGLLSLAAFVWFLAAYVHRATRVAEYAESAESPSRAFREDSASGDAGGRRWLWVGIAAFVAVALLLSRVLRVFPWFNNLKPYSTLPIWLAVVWVVAYALAGKLPLGSRLAAVGTTAGFLGVVLHSAVDFDLSSPGILGTMFALLGCQFALQSDELAETRKALSARGAVVVGAAFLAAFFVFSQVLKPLAVSNIAFKVGNARVQASLGKARAVLGDPSAGPSQWALVAQAARGEQPDTSRAAPGVAALLADITSLRESARHDPHYIEPHLALALVWRTLLAGALAAEGPSPLSDDLLAACERSYEKALAVNPRSGKAVAGLSALYGDVLRVASSERLHYLDKAIDYAARVLELYPTFPRANLTLGDLLVERYEATGDGADAREAGKYLKSALKLTSDLVREQHVKLTAGQKERARERLRFLRTLESTRAGNAGAGSAQ